MSNNSNKDYDMKVFKTYLRRLEEASHYYAIHGTESWGEQMESARDALIKLYEEC